MPLDQAPGDNEVPVESDLYDRPTPSVFEPFDPETVHPTSPAPPSSSDAPDFGGTSGEDGEPQDANPDEPQDHTESPEEKLPEFDRRWRDPFDGLLFLGALTSTFSLWGHEFVIRTLTTEDMAEIALLVKDYIGTDAKVTTYQCAVVAAAVVTVDQKRLPTPIEMGESPLPARYKYVLSKWYAPVREAIFEKVVEQEIVVRKVLDEMGKAFG